MDDDIDDDKRDDQALRRWEMPSRGSTGVDFFGNLPLPG
jgi:hypothetical protein